MTRRTMVRALKTLLFTLALGLNTPLQANELRFASFPDVSDKLVVFAYRDAIWTVPAEGGSARLLSDIGTRPRNPKLSPDGTTVAYTASVDDNVDVYLVPVSGGPIKRLTHHPARDDMIDWYPDGKSIMFKSTMMSPHANFNRLFKLDIRGGLPQLVALPYGETAAISADGNEILFTYLKDFQEEVWKRYYGGRAPDIWALNSASGETTRLTDHSAPDSVPMIHDKSVFFLSERGDEMRSNLWRLDREDGNLTQLSRYTQADVRHPSIGEAGIVFELDGGLYLLDIETGESRQIEINLAIARQEQVPRLEVFAEQIENMTGGPNGHLAIEARGDLFIYDFDQSIVKNITRSSQSAERYPSLSPDETSLAYFSDQSGEYQLMIRELTSGKEEQLTEFENGFRYRPFWSPDGKHLVFMDQQQIIWLFHVKSKELKQIDQGHWRYHWDMQSFRINWSPDGQWLTYSLGGENRNQALYVYNTKTHKKHQLTSAYYSDFDPVFDPNGNFLAALSFRSFSPSYGDIDTTFVYKDSTVVSLLALTDDIALPGETEWLAPDKREEVTIDLEGIEARMIVLPLPPGSYSALAFQDGSITVAQTNADGRTRQMLRLDLGSDKPEVILDGAIENIFDASENSTILKTTDGKYLQVFPTPGNESKEILTQKLTAVVDRRAEYIQMFDDSWRYQRDFYYDPGLHGVDWDAIRAHYRPQAAEAHSDQELTAIVREMHGELAAGHIYVSTEPPYNRRDAKDVGLLGVDFATKNDAYFISKILKTGPRRFEHRSPLDNPALNVSEGDFLLAINNKPLKAPDNPWALLAGLADQHVELTIADNASGANSRILTVKTLASERKLRELAWVEDNRKQVDDASKQQIGYIYLPNTGSEGLNELMQSYRAQYHKKALIIDERFNRGGALGDRFVELLNRPPLTYFSSRNGNDYPLPEFAHRGPKAMLINSWSYSGGDGLPYLFKTAQVGPLIGTRTWGGLIGPGMRMSLVNGGFISAPPQRVYDIQGNWAEGNEGVKPNIPLLNNPGKLAAGTDEQLNLALVTLLEKIDQMEPVQIPAFPQQTPEPEVRNQ